MTVVTVGEGDVRAVVLNREGAALTMENSPFVKNRLEIKCNREQALELRREGAKLRVTIELI